MRGTGMGFHPTERQKREYDPKEALKRMESLLADPAALGFAQNIRTLLTLANAKRITVILFPDVASNFERLDAISHGYGKVLTGAMDGYRTIMQQLASEFDNTYYVEVHNTDTLPGDLDWDGIEDHNDPQLGETRTLDDCIYDSMHCNTPQGHKIKALGPFNLIVQKDFLDANKKVRRLKSE
jgi:hypothetical protein